MDSTLKFSSNGVNFCEELDKRDFMSALTGLSQPCTLCTLGILTNENIGISQLSLSLPA